jgi:hypothetical protein
MCILLELCFISYVLSYVFESVYAVNFFTAAYYSLGQVIYTIFAVKYFILALKLEAPAVTNLQRLQRTEIFIFAT